jgi:hypothetical protein
MPASGPALSVNPAEMTAAASRLLNVAGVLRSALPAVSSAWAAAGHALAAHRTGEVLSACQSSASAALDGCLRPLEAYAQTLRRAAVVYANANSAAVPTVPVQRTP